MVLLYLISSFYNKIMTPESGCGQTGLLAAEGGGGGPDSLQAEIGPHGEFQPSR